MIAPALDLCAWTLLLWLALNRLSRARRGNPRSPPALRATVLCATVLALALCAPVVPLHGGISLLWVLRGLFADVSPSSALLLAGLAADTLKGTSLFEARERRWLPLACALPAPLFYPFALGVGPLDPYAWGYGEALALPLIVGALALAAWWANWRISALALVLALALWRLEALESTNLWDHLFDPLLVFGAMAILLARAVRRWRCAPPPA
ncbi:MAG: hypothetical protein LBI92_08425 [Azoarcus sp.]|jgi:hypothetical protein|nr:hypothetical protein [Azoarcus sp.]